MRGICLTKYGSIENFADFKVATGLFTFLHGRKVPMILGYEFSGVVDAVGSGQTRWKIGDPIFGFLPYGPGNNQGAFAEFLVTPENQVARKPFSVAHEQAAAPATAVVTALQ